MKVTKMKKRVYEEDTLLSEGDDNTILIEGKNFSCFLGEDSEGNLLLFNSSDTNGMMYAVPFKDEGGFGLTIREFFSKEQ